MTYENQCPETFGIGFVEGLSCMRESGHPGMHFDRAERLYWYPAAPELETVEIAPGVRAQKLPDRTNGAKEDR